ncbi:MAG: TolB-like 6-bladed beta-propeller domain-containing protein [Prevotellaceae bacterium]|jgi:hypothetical protein|nr:TolB-like 6-bladed beta-propeller domain-containing protein [Prevotellaceae bacterium]
MKQLISLSLAVFMLFSCKENAPYSFIDLSNTVTLGSPETLIEFDETHPVWLTLKDSTVFIIQVQTDYCMLAFNLKTKEVQYFGHKGSGPEEFVGHPQFIKPQTGDLLVQDANGIIKRVTEKNGTFSVEKVEYKYPKKLQQDFSAGINFSDNFIVANYVNGEKMFYIYDKNIDSLIYADFYPKMNLESSTHPFINSIYAPSLGLNEKRNRIIAGMYYFDMFHVYDLSGKRINSFRFSDNFLPDLNADDWQGSVGGFIPHTFPTENYCYLKRITKISQSENNEKTQMILQVNWDGELIRAYKLQDDIAGFYIDEKNNKMYAIRNYVNKKDEEMFALVTYDLIPPTN